MRRLPKLQQAALRWLTHHDPEFDWMAYDRRPTHGRDYVGAVRDNVMTFGRDNIAPMARVLRKAVL